MRYTDIRDLWFGTSHWRSFQVWYSKVGIIMLRVEPLEMSLWLQVWMKICKSCKWEVGKECHDHSTRFPDWKCENVVEGKREWVYPDISIVKTMRWLNITKLQLGEVEFIGYDDMIIGTVVYLSLVYQWIHQTLFIKLYQSIPKQLLVCTLSGVAWLCCETHMCWQRRCLGGKWVTTRDDSSLGISTHPNK